MRPDILLIDAEWDTTTKYLYAFRRHFLQPDLNKYKKWELVGAKAVQPNVDQLLQAHRIGFISGAGHGFYHAFLGYLNSAIWEAEQDLTPLTGTIIHLLSCQTGATLGKSMVRQGAKAFWGYTQKFAFNRKAAPPADLHTDASAKQAIEMDLIIDMGILRRVSAVTIYHNVQDYVEAVTSGLPPSSLARAVIRDNFRHLVCPVPLWGDQSARL